MTDSSDTGQLLDQLRAGDGEARSRLIAHACERLRCLARRMLKGYPGVQRWEQTDDVLQNALLRLCRALETVTPDSPRHFYNLAAQHVRWELIDLARHYLGPQGQGAKHHTDEAGQAPDDPGGALSGWPGEEGEPDSLEAWTAFHQWVEALPDEERDVFDLLWYEGLTQEEAAAVLKVSLRTVKRRWQSARLLLAAAMQEEPPA
jgi:RNA polymerase sigma factor (sigma-70 family)